MIEHLRGRERALESLGWSGREAEWIALVCLHSGVFIRSQFCRYFAAHRQIAARLVQGLKEQKALVESEHAISNGGGRTCRISGKAIYRALGVENIRHRRRASTLLVMRRLLSLDYVLEHPGLNWLPTEPEKVDFFTGMGLPSRLIPRRIYYGAVGAQKRYFALKLPVAGEADSVVFAYVDPGHATAVELNTWGAAHGALWSAIRAAGRQVVVAAIAAELDRVMRSERVLQLWAEADPGKSVPGVPVKQEIALLKKALLDQDDGFFVGYGGEQGVVDRYLELQKLPEAGLAEGVKIDDYSTYRATCFAEVE